jgi:hypothetical protein
LQFAADDYRAACGLMAMSPPAIRQALVQGQQAAEKALKAFLIGNGQLYPLTHDLEKLRELCVAIDATLDAVARPCFGSDAIRQPDALPRLPGSAGAGASMAVAACRRGSRGCSCGAFGGTSQEPVAGMK